MMLGIVLYFIHPHSLGLAAIILWTKSPLSLPKFFHPFYTHAYRTDQGQALIQVLVTVTNKIQVPVLMDPHFPVGKDRKC